MTYIETPRLILRDWKEEDILPFSQLNADAEVMEYFLNTFTYGQSREFAERYQKEFNQFGYGFYVLERKEDGTFLGFTGFHNVSFEVDFAPAVEIGWRLRKEDWNKGYVTEAAKACLEYAKINLPFNEVVSFTSVLNKRSERIMQKIGMTKIREFNHPMVSDGHPLKTHVLYKIVL